MLLLLNACAKTSNELPIPNIEVLNGGTSTVSPQFAALEGGVPDGTTVAFLNEVVILRGVHFQPDMKAFLGLNTQLARRPDSLLTTDRFRLPDEPFVYTDPVTGQETILEVEVPIDFSKGSEVRISIPPEVACSPAFTNPIVRLYGQAGSSVPTADVYHIVGPRAIALTPRQGLDLGDYSVTLHGDFFSPYTQVAIRYVDPADGITKVIGTSVGNDITEEFVDRHTMIIPNWPGIVPNVTFGLAEELDVDLLLFESIDEINGSLVAEPGLEGVRPCASLEPESPEIPLVRNGVRNSEKANAFTFLPSGVTDFPRIDGITPESGSEIGGNTVIIVGQQFDAFTVDLSDPENPGIGIECPPDSGNYIPPLRATLVDRQTVAITMPPCEVDIPSTVNFCMRNKYSIDRPDEIDGAGPFGDCVVFEDIYTYIPIPPIEPPVLTAIYPSSGNPQPQGEAADFGLQRLMVVGDWFDQDTALNGGFEFLLPNGDIVQSQRTVFHNRNLIEVYTKRLPDTVFPLTEDLIADVRIRNTIGHSDFAAAMVFRATPDAGETPILTEIFPASGPAEGGNQMLLFGENFDTTTTAFIGEAEATDIQFINDGLIIATVPAGVPGLGVSVRVVDDGEASLESFPYTYDDAESPEFLGCPAVAVLDPTEGSSTGGYDVLVYGIDLGVLTRFEFGVGSNNFAQNTFFISDNLIRVTVPEARPEQVGATVQVGATDPLIGCDEALRTADFTYLGFGPPEILFVQTTEVDPITPTDLPALNVGGGDRMLVIGRNFDQTTFFDITKPQESENTSETTDLVVLTPNLAVMTSPASPDGLPGIADLIAHNSFGDSDPFAVEYVEPGPPEIIDVRNLDDGTQSAPIDGNDRLLIFGDNFYEPVTVRLTGCDLATGETEITRTLVAPDVTILSDHILGVNIPANTFCEGPLAIEVETSFGVAEFNDEGGEPLFQLLGPQPPRVDGVFPQAFNSLGGEEAIFFGRNLTATTAFAVRTDLMPEGAFTPVLDTRWVSETTVLVTMPALPGGMPPAGAPGQVRAEELDADLVAKISGDPFTVSGDLFTVANDDAPVLLSVFPDHGTIDGGDQILLIGDNFLTATGDSNIGSIRIVDDVLGDIGTYTEASRAELPLDSLDPANRGKYFVLNDHEIVLLTNERAPISPEEAVAPADVILTSTNGNSQLVGGFTYLNTPAVRTPMLLGITPNETRLNGETSHLISGGFLTEADRIVLENPLTAARLTIPVDAGSFSEVNDNFLVFEMPDLSGTFSVGDDLSVYAEKDVGGSVLRSNKLTLALAVTFAGPPTLSPTISPATAHAFGGTAVTLSGTLFTPNSQVLFGTMPARHVVYVSPTELIAITPTLPVDVPNPGIDLRNIDTADGTLDLAVFTQGGWAVLEGGFEITPIAPPTLVGPCLLGTVPEGGTIHVVYENDFFVPGETTVTSSLGATITNIEVIGFDTVEFDYTAPTYAAGTAGPKVDDITVATNQGTDGSDCEIHVQLTPFVDDVSTDYSANDAAAPTNGVEDGQFVVGTIDGGNFMENGALVLEMRAGERVTLTEIDALAAFTRGGQFRVVDGETIEFSVPYRVPATVPLFPDGNLSIGPVALEWANDNGLQTTFADAFTYIVSVIDFDDNAFKIPTVEPQNTSPDKVAVGDINGDGVVDVVALAREFRDVLTDAEAFVYMSDTFGAGVDVNGDGITPDFAGSFTKSVIDNDDIKTNLYIFGRGSRAILANLDDDAQLEILIPGSDPFDAGGNDARLLIVDVNADGTLGTETVYSFSTLSASDAVAGIAVGNFDSDDDGLDIALAIGAGAEADRKLVVLASTSTAFSFNETATDIDDPFDNWVVGYLESGDFDGDGDDDLIWGQDRSNHAAPIVVAEVDASTGSITSQDQLTNLAGGRVWSIVTYDMDGDDKEDAALVITTVASGALLTDHTAGGLAVILSPLGLEADAYLPTGFAKEEGRYVTEGDVNGDGVPDLVASSSKGEMILFLGDGEGGFTDSGKSWLLPSVAGEWPSRSHAIDAADINGDGLAEIFMGDLGANPQSVVVWLNASR